MMHKNTSRSSSPTSGSSLGKSCGHSHEQEVIMDSSDIMKVVENEKVLGNFVDHKFQELDIDRDGMLSVNELQPAVTDIGAALGLLSQGTSPKSDQIYTENFKGEASPVTRESGKQVTVLNEFTHGKQEKISKTEFKEVLSDFLIGMAAGLKRDPVVILRIDGGDLNEFVKSPSFGPEILATFPEELPDGSLKEYIIKAFEKLTVDQGMPPATDPWVVSNILEQALESLGGALEQPVSQETFLAEFKRAAENVVQLLKEQPAIVAHSQNTFDGSGVKRLLSNKFELDKTLDSALKDLPRDCHGKISKECLSVALDSLAASAGIPPLVAVDQMNSIINGALKMFNAVDGKAMNEEEFKKLLIEVLRGIMLQLEGSPVSVSVNSVVHEPLASSSTLL